MFLRAGSDVMHLLIHCILGLMFLITPGERPKWAQTEKCSLGTFL